MRGNYEASDKALAMLYTLADKFLTGRGKFQKC